MLEITIIRTRVRNLTTDGYLSIGGRQICETAENSQHCIPPGTYSIQFVGCQQYGMKMPLIMTSQPHHCSKCMRKKLGSIHGNLPCFCPMIKVGNGVFNRTDGSIIVGKNLQPGILLHSGNAFEKLYQRIKKAVQRQSDIQLTIK